MDHPGSSLRLESAGGRLLDDLLAKPEDDRHNQKSQNYREHVVQVYRAWCRLKENHAPVVDRIAQRHGLAAERLLQSSLLCVMFHDLGKLTENFQRMMRARNDAERHRANLQNYRHEVIPLWFVHRMATALAQESGSLPGDGYLEVLAVAGHHRYLQDNYLFDESRFDQSIEWTSGADAVQSVRAAFQLARAAFIEQGWTLPEPRVATSEVRRQFSHDFARENYPFKFLQKARRDIAGLCFEKPRSPSAFRELFTLLKGLLMIADWTASGDTGGIERLSKPCDTVWVPVSALRDHIVRKVDEDRQSRPSVPPFTDFRPFQNECRDAGGHVIAIAPTGSGKTEAALLWSLRQAEDRKAGKLLFLLPTMVTANSLHRRLEAFFHQHGHRVGLVHSTADLIRENDRGEGDDTLADVRGNLLQERHFFPPVTVATIDQLLVTLLHAGRWAMKTLAAANAAIVIDEIHAYDPHTAGLVELLIRQLRPLGTRFLVMSATMPSDLRETIAGALDDGTGTGDSQVSHIEEPSLLDSARNAWRVCDEPLTQWLTSIDTGGCAVPSENIRKLLRRRSDRKKPLRVLIVVNTVQRCQELAELLREFGPVCYHSKFIFDDRRRKEALISDCRPRLLIATQVVEVSLDIDYDILLTECAPIDALVQRAGRVNRPRRPVPGEIIVFRHEQGSDHVYGQPAGILEATWELLCARDGAPLTERDLLRLVEEAYAGRRLTEHDEFRAIQEKVQGLQERLYGVLDSPRPTEEDNLLKTRLDRYLQVTVIPEQFVEEASQARPHQRRRYELQMPAWYARQFRYDGPNPHDLPICRMEYDSEFGGRFKNRDTDPVETGHQIF